MKHKKLIGLSIIPITPLIVLGTINSNANTKVVDAVPTVQNTIYENNKVKISWDTPIPESSVFFNETFEDLALDLPNGIKTNVGWYGNGVTYDPYGNLRDNNSPVRHSLKVLENIGYNGTKGVQAYKSSPNNGWNYTYYPYLPKPNGFSNYSIFEVSNWKKLVTGRPAIVRLKAKGSGIAYVSASNGWSGNSTIDSSITWAENLSADEFKSRLINNQPIKINNPNGRKDINYHLTTSLDKSYSYNFLLSLGNFELQNGIWVFQPYSWHGAWSDSVKPGQYVTPSSVRNVESVTVGKPLTALLSNGGGSGSINIDTDVWTDYSFNINIPHSESIVATGSYFKYSNSYSSTDLLYVDEVKLAYAPKSKLYRDGNLIMDSSFTVEFTDNHANDNAKPNAPKVSMAYEGNKLKLTWNEVADNGTSYSYQATNVNEFDEESVKSPAKTVEATSGIKNYEIYLNNNLIGTTTSTSFILSDSLNSSSQIKVISVDNVGNKSDYENLDIPKLTAKVNVLENMIRLDWNVSNTASKIYKVYQKKEGSTEYQTIGNNNFSSEVKVLNIYPVIDVIDATTKIPTETFTNWKGETFTLPQSARLKRWMEEPNAENSKGYGQGVISVDGVGINDFNSNPDNYLKNSDGSWKYNVIMIGSWDYNGNRFANSDMTTEGALKIQDFIDAGNGLLIGHDVVSTINPIMMNQFKDDIRVEVKYIAPSVWGTGISVKKKGVLTNFPWVIGDNLKIPNTHTQSQVCYGDIWMNFTDSGSFTDSAGGELNSYLSTNNNFAMIQTGHSRGVATPDEQKILANTLFYLNQLSSDNFLDDYSGQDVKAPNTPQIYEHNFTEDGFINLKFNKVQDNGNTYSYYVQAEDKNDLSVVSSNIVTETITSGVKGYSFVVDELPTTIPDDIIEQVDNKDIKIKTNASNELYLHLKSIDNVSNASETYHYRITDMTKPTLKFELLPSNWTNGTVTINVVAIDSDSGIKEVILPNGSIIKDNVSSYTVSQNGVYYFKAVDFMGNISVSEVRITNIDKNKPTVTINNNQNWTNQDVQVNITGNDY